MCSVGGGFQGRSLFEHIVSVENLFWAWKEFCRGKRKKPDVAQFEFSLEENIFQLHEDLIAWKYVHAPYESFYVRDPKVRHIHKAGVRDRIVHQAIFRVLYPHVDRFFVFDSYSCRFNKGTHAAANRLHVLAQKCSHNWKENIFALQCDVKRFFDSIEHETLLRLLSERIADTATMRLVGLVVRSFEKEERKGLPLGNVTSQLFANVYLNELDQFVKRQLKERYYVRYCDDFVILSQDINSLYKTLARIRIFLCGDLGLFLHDDKISVRKYAQGIDFLGYVDFPRFRIMRTRTKRRMIRRLEKERKALRSGIINKRHFENSLQSYTGILKHCNGHKIREAIIAKYVSTV